MATRIQIRRDTSANWEANNPVLALGEPGLETDTFIIKYGDGSTAWNSLPYANVDSLADFTTTDLAEGNNLYFSNARVYANLLLSGLVTTSYVNSLAFATNAQLTLYATNSELASYATNAQLASYATNNQLSLYATNVQLSDYATNNQLTIYATNSQLGLYATNAQLAARTTTVIPEGTNLYYTDDRVYGNVLLLGHATNSQLSSYATNAQLANYATNAQLIANATTANVVEVTNLYFTNARVSTALTNTTANITLGNVMRLVNYTYDEMQALTGAQKGWIIFETSNSVFRGYNGTAWSNLG